jgi:hypothetical protein
MSDIESIVKLFENHGLSGKEAIAEALKREEREREVNLELERIKLEQIKQSGMNAGES